MKVIVSQGQVEEYLQRGYARSRDSLAEEVGVVWQLLTDEQRRDLVLMEVEDAKHRALSAPERAFLVRLRQAHMVMHAELVEVDVLEREGHQSYVAARLNRRDGHNQDSHAEMCDTADLAATPHEAVRLARADILRSIDMLRASANDLEDLLEVMEVL